MRIRIKHRTAYAYDTPVNSIIELLRMTPRNASERSRGGAAACNPAAPAAALDARQELRHVLVEERGLFDVGRMTRHRQHHEPGVACRAGRRWSRRSGIG